MSGGLRDGRRRTAATVTAMAGGLECRRLRLRWRWLVGWKADGSGCSGAGWWAGRRTAAAATALASALEGGRLRLRQRWLMGWKADGCG